MSRKWYYTQDVEGTWYGACETKEDAIAEGRSEYDGEGFYITWAESDPLRLADYIGGDQLLERADDYLFDTDRVCPEYDDGPLFNATPEQESDLIERIKRACDEWQEVHGLSFVARTFSRMGDDEWIARKERDAHD